MPLPKQTITIPLAAGLQTKADPRAIQPPGLSACSNAIFDETGGIQTRKPYETHSSLANLRRLAVYGDRRVAFTSTGLSEYSEGTDEWCSTITDYVAPKVTERPVFVDNGEQSMCDRAELNGVIVYAWLSDAANDVVYVAAVDKATGSVIRGATSQGTGTYMPRLVALTTRILLFCKTAANTLGVKAIDVTSRATFFSTASAAFTNVDASGFGGSYYDVCADSATTAFVAWTRTTTTSYGYAQVNQTPTVTASTKARDSVGAVGVAKAPSAFVAVIRCETTTAVRADVLTSAFVDSTTEIAFGTTAAAAKTIACAFRSTQDSGDYRCYGFYTHLNASGFNEIRTNYVITAGTTGTDAAFMPRNHANASRAFDHGGQVYVWVVFDGIASGTQVRLQNTYFLWRDDSVLIAKAAPGFAGGAPTAVGHLPGVQNTATNQYAFCGVERRRVPLSATDAYSDRGPREIILDMDSNEARRCVQLGRTLYVTGGQILQYDGDSLAELGFHLYPYSLGVSDGGAGNLADGSYTWWATLRSDNAQGERDRSTTATLDTAAMAGGSSDAAIVVVPVRPTRRSTAATMEVWRTAVSPVDGSPAFLVTSEDPTATGDNGYQFNNTAGTAISFNDNFADATLITKQTYYETGGVLENIAPPPATIIAASADRLFIAGISYDPCLIWYSKLRAEGEVAAFNDALTIQLPPTSGDITALAFLNETLVAFCERGVYALPGDGFDNVGGGQNYGPARLIASDVGAQSADAVAVTPQGVVFKSSKGWFLLDRGFGVQYIGAPVADYDSDTVSSIIVMEEEHQIRITTSERVLLFDYLVGQWSTWAITDADHAVIWSGDYNYATSAAVKHEVAHGGATQTNYALDITTAWISTANYQRIYSIMPLGEYRSAHALRIRLYRDYDDATVFQDKTWTVSPTTVGGPLQVSHGPSVQKMQAIKIRITAELIGSAGTPPTGEALKLTAIALEVGVKSGLHRVSASQRQ